MHKCHNSLQLFLSNVHSPCLIKNEQKLQKKKKKKKNRKRDTNKTNWRKKKQTNKNKNKKQWKQIVNHHLWGKVFLFCFFFKFNIFFKPTNACFAISFKSRYAWTLKWSFDIDAHAIWRAVVRLCCTFIDIYER